MKTIEFNGTTYEVKALERSEQRRNQRIDKYNVVNEGKMYTATLVTQFKGRLDNVGATKVTRVVETKQQRKSVAQPSIAGSDFADKLRKAVRK